MKQDQTLELYGAPTGNCWRAAIALEEAGIPYRARVVDLYGGEHRETTFLELNPAGKVPVLMDRSSVQPFVLSQSNAVVLYAAELAPGRLLSVTDRKARAHAYERYFYFLTDVIAVGHAAFSLRGPDDAASRHILNSRMLAALAFAERFASASRYIAGDTFTIADVAAVTITASVAGQLDWDELPHLKRWFDEVMSRPSVSRGMSAFALR